MPNERSHAHYKTGSWYLGKMTRFSRINKAQYYEWSLHASMGKEKWSYSQLTWWYFDMLWLWSVSLSTGCVNWSMVMSSSVTPASDTFPAEIPSGTTKVILFTVTDKYYFLNSVPCRNGSCGDANRWIKQPPYSFKELPINMQSISACTETEKSSSI